MFMPLFHSYKPREIERRLNTLKTPTPTGKHRVWQVATVRNILTNRVYAGQARYNYRQAVVPRIVRPQTTNCGR
jgi:hypothetical protein